MADPQTLNDSPEAALAALRPRLRIYLPSDLAARLDGDVTPQVLAKVVSTLHSLHHNLGTYLPRSLVLSNPKPGVPRGQFAEGTVLFADVTGFTPLAERLRALGEEGAERLNQMINDLFTALLDPLSRSRGELLIFAGDAVQALFPAMDDAEDAVWAVRAGLRMTRAIAPFDTGPTPLSMSVGLARGRFFAAQTGTARRMEYLVTGGPIQRAMEAEEKAVPGQVSMAPGMEALLADQFRHIPIADGHHAVIDDLGDDLGNFELSGLPARRRYRGRVVLDRDPAALMEAIATTLYNIETLAPFFPSNVLRRIVAHQRERLFPGEHRLVAVMFVNLRGFEALIEALGPKELPQLTAWVNRYFVEAQETLAGCGGLVTHVDPYAKGFTLLCPFGAPLADEETPHRATAAALRLNEKLRSLNRDLQAALRDQVPDQAEELQLTHHIGITYGPIYTGQVGWQERREYVVVGDDVNLSARLMSKSQPDQILISGWVHDRVRQAFECRPLEPMKLKGKAKPVTVYAVERRVPASAWLVEAAVGQLVGRDEELTSLDRAMDALEEGRGGVLTLVGETGMGKSRLVAELAGRARYWNVTLLAGRCLSYAQSSPYAPWIEGLWRWFELDTAADKAERRARVSQALKRLGLGQLAETFWTLLGLPQAEASTPLRRTFSRPQGRQGRLNLYSILQERIAQATPAHQDLHLTLAWRLAEHDPALAVGIPSLWEHLGQRIHPDQALLTLFKEIARQDKPVLFIVEDLQWADQASWTALVNLARATSSHPVLLLVTARLDQIEKHWQAETGAERLILTGLSQADTGRLATRLIMSIMAREAAPELVSWLHRRTRGNPLFASQLLRALIGTAALSTETETGRVTLSKTLPSLPLSVREIMLSRVDQLPEETRAVVKLASVIGDIVSWDLLTHLSPKAGSVSEVRLAEHLKTLAERSLLAPAPPATEFTFVHPLLQEAVYSSVPYAQRRHWHRAIADYLAQKDVETVHQHLEALAYHYNRSDAPKLGVQYNRLAGDKARARQVWDEALGYYQATIDITGLDAELGQERSLAYECLGDVYALTERYVEAASAYEAALAEAVETPHTARLEGKLGLVCPLLDSMDEATQRMERAWDELDDEDGDAPLRPWLAAALGWLALRARPKDMAAVAGAGAAAVRWWHRGQRTAKSNTAQVALKEMMAGRVLTDYSRLVHLALGDSGER
jgi:class 3 adenylate cyclase/tetratricopeptide (TPR) repeat protein